MSQGSNFFTPISATCWIALTEEEQAVGADQQKVMLAKCTGTPPRTAGIFEHGCLMIQTDSGFNNSALFENIGTPESPSWTTAGVGGAQVFHLSAAFSSASKISTVAGVGYSGESGFGGFDNITVGGFNTTSGGGLAYQQYGVYLNFAFGLGPISSATSSTVPSRAIANVMFADGHFWAATDGGNDLYQDGVAVTGLHGGSSFGAMSWDPVNKYLIVMGNGIGTSQVTLYYYTYSGTVLTYVKSQAFTATGGSQFMAFFAGWAYDALTDQYYFYDQAIGGVMWFDNIGTQLGFSQFFFADQQRRGVVIINRRVYIALSEGGGSGPTAAGAAISFAGLSFLPTDVLVA